MKAGRFFVVFLLLTANNLNAQSVEGNLAQCYFDATIDDLAKQGNVSEEDIKRTMSKSDAGEALLNNLSGLAAFSYEKIEAGEFGDLVALLESDPKSAIFVNCAEEARDSISESTDAVASSTLSARDVVSYNFYELSCSSCKVIPRGASCIEVAEFVDSFARNSSDARETIYLRYTAFKGGVSEGGVVQSTVVDFVPKYPKEMSFVYNEYPLSFEAPGTFSTIAGEVIDSGTHSYDALKLTQSYPKAKVANYFVRRDGLIYGYETGLRLSFKDAVQGEPVLSPCTGPIPEHVKVFGPSLDEFGLTRELEVPRGGSGLAGQLCYTYLTNMPVIFNFKRQGIPLDRAYGPIDSAYNSSEKLYRFLALLVQDIYRNESGFIAHYNSGRIVDNCVNYVMR